MNIETSDERLLRTERERDEARAENASLRQALTGRTVSCGACEQTTRERDEALAEVAHLESHWRADCSYCGWQNEVATAAESDRAYEEHIRTCTANPIGAELARLRAAANERAIAVLEELHSELAGWGDSKPMVDREILGEILRWCDEIRAETPAAPQPAPSGGVERAIAELECQRDRLAEACQIVGRSYDVCDAASPLWSYDRLSKRIAALRAEQQAAPVPPPVTPPADAPNDPTKNVCAIRRRSDGYWWECNGEHGAGWNDKRIRQAWTHRAAHVEVERMKASGVRDDVEVVELAPKPSPEATSGYRSLDHAISILSGCLAPYSGEQAQAVAKALKQMHDRSTPPADAPSRPSVEELRDIKRTLESQNGSYDHAAISGLRIAVRLLLDDALAGRGGAK